MADNLDITDNYMDDGRTVEEYYDEVERINDLRDAAEEDTIYDRCFAQGHVEEIVYEDDTGIDWRCTVCGAEGWDDVDG